MLSELLLSWRKIPNIRYHCTILVTPYKHPDVIGQMCTVQIKPVFAAIDP